MGVLALFLKVFGVLILMFASVMLFYVYPVNVLYNNEKYVPKGDTRVLFIWGIIFVALIDCLLYFYYNFGTTYLCTVSKYITCVSSISLVAVYVLMFIHFIVLIGFSFLFLNYLYTEVKTKKLDLLLFIYASISIVLLIANYNIYNNLFVNIKILYYIVRGLLYIVTYSPIYGFLVVTLLTKLEFKKKKKVVKKSEVKKVEEKKEEKEKKD